MVDHGGQHSWITWLSSLESSRRNARGAALLQQLLKRHSQAHASGRISSARIPRSRCERREVPFDVYVRQQAEGARQQQRREQLELRTLYVEV